MAAPRPAIYDIGKTIKSKLFKPAQTSIYEVSLVPTEETKKFILARDLANGGSPSYDNDKGLLLRLSCSDAALPGSTVATNDLNTDKFHGSTHRYGYRRIYDDRADFTFYVDAPSSKNGSAGYNIIWFFEQWIAHVVGEDLQEDQLKENYSYRVNYPNIYQGNIYITKFEKDINLSNMGKSGVQLAENSRYLEYQYIKAFPISINSMPVSYEQSQLLKCTVSFTYLRYVVSRKSGAGFVESSSINNSAARNTQAGQNFNINNQIGDFNVPNSPVA